MRLRWLPPVVLVMTALGCLEFPPRIVPADAGAPEGDGATPPVDAGPSACVECIMAPEDPGPGCKTYWDMCKDDARCVGLVQCTDEIHCFRISALQDFLTCVDPCIKKYMFMGTSDPLYPIVTQIVLCTTGVGACVPICSGSSAQPAPSVGPVFPPNSAMAVR